MKKFLFLLALVVALGAASFWTVRGAHRGWTKTSVPVRTVDEVTGIEAVQYQPRFVPGLDFLGASFAGVLVLLGASFLFRNNQTNHS